jgi:hypothetical protein
MRSRCCLYIAPNFYKESYAITLLSVPPNICEEAYEITGAVCISPLF